MSLRSLMQRVLTRWEASFERAAAPGHSVTGVNDGARGEFISTLIVNPDSAPKPGETGFGGGLSRD